MALQTGEVYKCPNPECGCEIKVTQGAAKAGGDMNPRCCCGMEMQKQS